MCLVGGRMNLRKLNQTVNNTAKASKNLTWELIIFRFQTTRPRQIEQPYYDCFGNLRKNASHIVNINIRMVYDEWVPVLEKKHNLKVLDPDGAREVYRKDLQKVLMTEEEAEKYFLMNTVIGKVW